MIEAARVHPCGHHDFRNVPIPRHAKNGNQVSTGLDFPAKQRCSNGKTSAYAGNQD